MEERVESVRHQVQQASSLVRQLDAKAAAALSRAKSTNTMVTAALSQQSAILGNAAAQANSRVQTTLVAVKQADAEITEAKMREQMEQESLASAKEAVKQQKELIRDALSRKTDAQTEYHEAEDAMHKAMLEATVDSPVGKKIASELHAAEDGLNSAREAVAAAQNQEMVEASRARKEKRLEKQASATLKRERAQLDVLRKRLANATSQREQDKAQARELKSDAPNSTHTGMASQLAQQKYTAANTEVSRLRGLIGRTEVSVEEAAEAVNTSKHNAAMAEQEMALQRAKMVMEKARKLNMGANLSSLEASWEFINQAVKTDGSDGYAVSAEKAHVTAKSKMLEAQQAVEAVTDSFEALMAVTNSVEQSGVAMAKAMQGQTAAAVQQQMRILNQAAMQLNTQGPMHEQIVQSVSDALASQTLFVVAQEQYADCKLEAACVAVAEKHQDLFAKGSAVPPRKQLAQAMSAIVQRAEQLYQMAGDEVGSMHALATARAKLAGFQYSQQLKSFMLPRQRKGQSKEEAEEIELLNEEEVAAKAAVAAWSEKRMALEKTQSEATKAVEELLKNLAFDEDTVSSEVGKASLALFKAEMAQHLAEAASTKAEAQDKSSLMS